MASKIKGITVEIGGSTAGLDKALKGVNDNSRKLQSELREVNKQLKFEPQNTELLNQKQQLLAESITNTKDKLKALHEAQKQVEQQFKNGEIGEEQYRAFQREVIKTESQLKTLEKQAKDTGDSMAKSLEKASEKIGKVGESLENAGKKALPLSGAVAGIGIAGGKMALDFQDYIANINTLLDDDSNLKGYESAVVQLSNSTGKSVELMADGMYQAISSIGDGGKQTELIFGTMAKSAKAGGADVADAVSLISAGMKGYNQVNDETASKISDLAFQTAKLGVTTFPEMAKSMQSLFPLANSLSLSYEELFGVMATGTGVTGNTSEVTTQFKAIMSGLMKPTSDMTKLIEKYGYSNAQAMIESESLTGVLEILKNETGGQSDKLATLFGSTEALTLATALTGSQFDTFKDKLESMGDATGATSTAYDKLNTDGDQVRKSFNKIKNTLNELGQSLITILAPIIQTISDKISQFASWFSTLDESQKKVIATMLLLIAGISPLLLIVGKMLTTISRIIPIIIKTGVFLSKAAPLFGTIGTALKALFGIITANPIIAVITVIVAGIIYLWNTNENFRNAVIQIWESIKTGIGNAVDGIIKFFTETIPKAFNAVMDFFKNNWQGILSLILNPFAGAIKLLYDNCDGFRKKVDEMVNAIIEFFKKLPDNIKTISTNIITIFSNLPKQMLDIGVNIVKGLWQGIKNTGGWLKEKANEFCSNFIDNVKNKFKIHSPSRVFAEIGTNITQGLSKGIESGGSDVLKDMSDLQTDMIATQNIIYPIRPKKPNDPVNTSIVNGGDTFIFNSPKALTPSENRRQVQKATRRTQLQP